MNWKMAILSLEAIPTLLQLIFIHCLHQQMDPSPISVIVKQTLFKEMDLEDPTNITSNWNLVVKQQGTAACFAQIQSIWC